MKFIDKVKLLINRGEIKEASLNILEDGASAILGDPIAIGKIILAIGKSPFFIREQLFWAKIEAFINGVFLSEEDRSNLRAKLTKCGEENDNPFRLIEYIDRAETNKKIRYLINATRCLLSDYIELSDFFRICHAVTHTLEEDLLFMAQHIEESNLPYNFCVQGLLTTGLMYQSIIDSNGNQKYSFTPIANQVDRYAVSFDNIERYPYPYVDTLVKPSSPQTSIPGLEWQTIEKAEVEKALSKI